MPTSSTRRFCRRWRSASLRKLARPCASIYRLSCARFLFLSGFQPSNRGLAPGIDIDFRPHYTFNGYLNIWLSDVSEAGFERGVEMQRPVASKITLIASFFAIAL